MKHFIKRNLKHLIVFGLCVICLVLYILNIRAGSVDEVKHVSRMAAGMETAPADFRSPASDDSGTDVVSGEAVTSQTEPDRIEKNKNKTSNSKDKTKDNNKDNNTPARKVSDGRRTNKDKYDTDPVPKGKPDPVNKEDQQKTKDYFYVYLSIDCVTILDHMDDLTEGLDKYVGDGTILKKTKVKCYEGESVWDVLLRECKAREINLESEYTPMYGSAYVEAINNLGEFDCGELSGWCYCVDDWFPNYGASRYVLKESEYIRWRYTCDLGRDLGITWN